MVASHKKSKQTVLAEGIIHLSLLICKNIVFRLEEILNYKGKH